MLLLFLCYKREVSSLRRKQKKGRVSDSEYSVLLDNLHKKYKVRHKRCMRECSKSSTPHSQTTIKDMEDQGIDLDIHVDVKFGMDRETDKKVGSDMTTI